ncbi:hypothetical protein [Corynebacterium sp. TAE3-ERU30]|nr:hypothetical protein [Corynebacterium sp. TAE3-ERU30]MBV7280959.1 hypothetical protein [Corynebacterium sp. TAE3-ERU30]
MASTPERTPGRDEENPGASRSKKLTLATEVLRFLTAIVKLAVAIFT